MKGKSFIIDYKIYPFNVLFTFGQQDEQVITQLKKQGVKDPTDCTVHGEGRCIMYSEGATMIRMNVVPKYPRQYAILQHEIFHAVDFLFNRIGIRLCENSNEAYAYLIEYLTKEAYEQIRK